jgi:hypothetical protein
MKKSGTVLPDKIRIVLPSKKLGTTVTTPTQPSLESQFDNLPTNTAPNLEQEAQRVAATKQYFGQQIIDKELDVWLANVTSELFIRLFGQVSGPEIMAEEYDAFHNYLRMRLMPLILFYTALHTHALTVMGEEGYEARKRDLGLDNWGEYVHINYDATTTPIEALTEEYVQEMSEHQEELLIIRKKVLERLMVDFPLLYSGSFVPPATPRTDELGGSSVKMDGGCFS